MKKCMKLFSIFILSVMLMSSYALAAPDSIGIYDSTGGSGLVSITNPDKQYSTTYSKTYSVSGFAASGSRVYVYVYDNATSTYKPYYENGAILSTTVGASGIFVFGLRLSAGKNVFLVRSEKDGAYQNYIFDINLLSSSMFSIRNSLQGIKLYK